jgi:hypothetical protein
MHSRNSSLVYCKTIELAYSRRSTEDSGPAVASAVKKEEQSMLHRGALAHTDLRRSDDSPRLYRKSGARSVPSKSDDTNVPVSKAHLARHDVKPKVAPISLISSEEDDAETAEANDAPAYADRPDRFLSDFVG